MGTAIVLPDAAQGRVALLVVGFTKSSAEAARAWEAQLAERYAKDEGVAVFRVAVLEAVPRFLRGVLKGKAREQALPGRGGAFVLLYHSEAAWKRAVAFDPGAEDDAYVVVLDTNGHVVLREHTRQVPASSARPASIADPLTTIDRAVLALHSDGGQPF